MGTENGGTALPARGSVEDLRKVSRGERFTTSRGVIHFVRTGTGPPIVLLHGLGSSHRSFDLVVPRLSKKRQVLAVDLLGHGNSDREARDFSGTAQAEALVQVMTEMRLDRAVLVGHALGGRVAVRAAASIPERVEKLVLIAAGSHGPPVSPFFRLGFVWEALGLLGRPARKRLVARLCGESAVDPDGVATYTAWKTLGRAFRQNSSPEALSEMDELVDSYLEHTTFVIWGSDDRVSPVGEARILFQHKRNVRLVQVAGGSHTLHEDQPDIVADLILEFLD